jgi:hypothetical protein
MNLSPRVALRVTSRDHVDVSGLILQMNLSTGRKNPYSILFPQTDSRGSAHLNDSDVQGQFKDHWEAGLMDYSGTLAEASQEVEFTLFDVAQLRAARHLAMAWPLLRYEGTVWRSRAEKVEYLLSCKNERVVLKPYRTELPLDGIVFLRVHPTHVAEQPHAARRDG